MKQKRLAIENLEQQTYHQIYLPRVDVFDEGGKLTFDEFNRKKDDGSKNLIVVPEVFLDELDKLSEDQSFGADDSLEIIRSSQYISKIKSEIKLFNYSEGLDIAILEGSEFKKDNFAPSKLEEKIKSFTKSNNPIKMITDNKRAHIKYTGNNIIIEEPEFLHVNENIVFEGIISSNEELTTEFFDYKNSSGIPIEVASEILGRNLYHNQFIRLPGKDGNDTFAIVTGKKEWNTDKTRIIGVSDGLVKLLDPKENNKHLKIGDYHTKDILGVSPRDMEQYLAMQYGLLQLMTKEMQIMFLSGKQGSGKTLLGFATSVFSTLQYDKEIREKMGLDLKYNAPFKQIILLKPPEILGGKHRDVGFLPGSLYEKLKPHLRPYYDAHQESILNDFAFEELFKHPKYANDFGQRSPEISNKKIGGFAHFSQKDAVIDLVYSGFIGGASIRDTLLIIDEAQDYTPYEIKTIIERMGEGCAAIISGDPLQTRNSKCSRKKNGLTFAIKNYLPKPYSGLVYLTRNYRSQASEDSESMKAYNT